MVKDLVVCQGVKGSNSYLATKELFKNPIIKYCDSFNDVIYSVVNKGCFGMLPIWNNLSGDVKEVKTILESSDVKIVDRVSIKVEHNLLTKEEMDVDKIKIIYSQKYALKQCSNFLEMNPEIKIVECENTAVAAKKVSLSKRNDIAAIASKECAAIYNLKCIMPSIQNDNDNFTTFVCLKNNE